MNKQSHIHKKADSSASNPVRSQLQSRSCIVQAQPQSNKHLTQTQTENQEFQQQKFEATKLEIQAKYGTITPEGQEQLTLLQAKMSGSLQRKLQQASQFGHNFANIPISRPNAPSQSAVQTKLTIGEPGDKYEQEADQVAAEVVQQINAPASPQQIIQNKLKKGVIQRVWSVNDVEEPQYSNLLKRLNFQPDHWQNDAPNDLKKLSEMTDTVKQLETLITGVSEDKKDLFNLLKKADQLPSKIATSTRNLLENKPQLIETFISMPNDKYELAGKALKSPEAVLKMWQLSKSDKNLFETIGNAIQHAKKWEEMPNLLSKPDVTIDDIKKALPEAENTKIEEAEQKKEFLEILPNMKWSDVANLVDKGGAILKAVNVILYKKYRSSSDVEGYGAEYRLDGGSANWVIHVHRNKKGKLSSATVKLLKNAHTTGQGLPIYKLDNLKLIGIPEVDLNKPL